MSTSLTFSPFSVPSVESYQDAVDRLRILEDRARGIIGTIKKSGLDLVRVRYEQGQLADMALRLTNARMEDLAEQVNVGPKTLYDAHIVYRRFKSRTELERQIRLWEEEGREVTWSMVRSHARNRLPDDTGRAQAVLQDRAQKLEKKAQKLESEALDLEQEAERARTAGERVADPVLADELEGVAAKAREVAGDTRRQAGALRQVADELPSDPKPQRVESPHYLARIRQRACLQCGAAEGVQAHYLDRGGMGTKGPDFFTVPLCAECHGQLHQYGDRAFWGDVNPWKFVATYMLEYFAS